MTNKEWLDYLAHNAPDELAAWFDAEHVETKERALDGDTDALEAKQAICTVTVDYDDLRDKLFEELQRDYIIMTSEEYGELTAERDKLKGQAFTLKVECDDLTSACDDLENELYRAKTERERYREKFGKCLDYADAIHALMDDEGMA